jgi:hypothetical protein
MKTNYTVLLANGTTGTISTTSINGQNPSDFIGEIVRISTKDENGYPVEVEGALVEVLE